MPRRLLLALLVLVFVAGCSGDPEPRVEQSPSATASVSPSVSASPAAETAEEFIARWAQLSTSMQSTGNTTPYREITTGCQPCTKLADLVDTYYKAGGFVEFDGLTVSGIERQESVPGVEVYDVAVSVGLTSYKTSQDSKLRRLKGGNSTYRMTLTPIESTWQLTDYTELSS